MPSLVTVHLEAAGAARVGPTAAEPRAGPLHPAHDAAVAVPGRRLVVHGVGEGARPLQVLDLLHCVDPVVHRSGSAPLPLAGPPDVDARAPPRWGLLIVAEALTELGVDTDLFVDIQDEPGVRLEMVKGLEFKQGMAAFPQMANTSK